MPTADPYSAIVYTANQGNVLMTMVAGRIVYDSGDHPLVDAEKALALVQSIRGRLRG